MLILFSCTEEFPELSQSSTLVSIKPSNSDFFDYVKGVTDSTQDQIHENFGDPFLEAASTFIANNGTEVVLVPYFRKDSKRVEAFLLATKYFDQVRLGLLEHGELYKLDQSVIPHRVLANLFKSYDDLIFTDHSETLSSIIGNPLIGGTKAPDYPILMEDEFDEPTEWVGYYDCTMYWLGTADDPYQHYMYTDCVMSYYWEESPQNTVIIDAGGSGGGGGSYTPIWPRELRLFQDVGGAIENINEYLKCFKANQSGKVTIYVDQPKNNSSDTYSGNVVQGVDVGHTFVSIQQGNVQRTFGFYPKNGVQPIINPNADPILINDSGHDYHVKIEINVTAGGMNAVLNTARNFQQTGYNLNNYNCTDFAMAMSEAAGVSLPDTRGRWPGGGGSNPGNLGQDLRGMGTNPNYSVNDSPGSAPSNSGNCN